MKDLYDMITNELNNKSIAALYFLIDNGREVSFKYNNIEYALTWRDKKLHLDNENKCDSQEFKNAWVFMENAIIQGEKFVDIWEKIELMYLY